jgi:hypothetical protein
VAGQGRERRFFGEQRFGQREQTAVIERDEADEWPTEGDAITSALSQLIIAVIEETVTGSRERAAAMNEVLAVGARIRAALVPGPRLN